MKQYVIIGNGVAAVGCIEGIRKIDTKTPIIVVSEEPHPVYGRPLISYYLEGKTDLAHMNYREKDFYKEMGCEVLYGKKVAKINKRPKTVILDDASEIPYSSICVATGSSPFVPPFEGLDSVEKQFSFMTLDDAEGLKKELGPDKKVLIIGAGLIGLKCAEGILESVGSITVCDLADRLLSSILDEECAALMQKQLESKGIQFLLGDSVARFDKTKAYMNSGKEIDFDIVVMAVGVRANTGLVKELGGKVNRGILVNTKMETSIAGIYSAGDCTEGHDITLGGNRVLAILPNAYMQGHCAGVNMAGGDEVFDKAMPMNSIGFFGLHAMTAGTYYSKEDGGECYEEKTETSIKRLYTKDGLLTGFILIGRDERAGIYTSLIREKTPLSTINFDLLKTVATTCAFDAETRRKKFSVPV